MFEWERDRERVKAEAASLTVAETEDEFGQARFFIEDGNAEWVGEPFDSASEAWATIARMQKTIGADFDQAETALERAARREIEEGFPGRRREPTIQEQADDFDEWMREEETKP